MRENKGEHPWGDAGQLIALGLFLLIWGGDSFFLHASTFLAEGVPLILRLLLLGLAIAAAVYLFSSGHVVLSEEQRPARVITTGPFRYVRHPLYLASLLIYLGLAVSTMSLVSFVLLVGIFAFHDYIASYEEKIMEAKFGEEYRRYEQETGKWIPRMRRAPTERPTEN